MNSIPSPASISSIVILLLACAPALANQSDTVAMGERLVHNLDCGVCHTPKEMTPEGPRPDSARLLSGHPRDKALPKVPEGVIGPLGWGGLFAHGLTAWVGPWGTSYATNLTSDEATGIGSWSEEDFVHSLRTGTHMEENRPFLPPMPTYSRLTDEELHAIFTYLRSIPPVDNDVPGARIATPSLEKSQPNER